MTDISTGNQFRDVGKMVSRRDSLKGLAAILAAGVAPALLGQTARGLMHRNLGGRIVTGGGKKKYSVLDYVQAGLVDIVDFYENAGYGVFDPNPSNWYSLKSTDVKFTPWASRWGALPHFRSDGFAYAFYSINCSFSTYDKVSLDGDFTVEFVGRGKNGFCGVGNYANPTTCAPAVLGAYKVWTYNLPTSFSAIFNSPFSTTHKVRAVCHERIVKFGNDGYGIYDDSPVDFSGKSFASDSVLAEPKSTSAEGAVNVKCLRIYNRVLSASELAANDVVDKARFNLSW